MLPFAMDPYSLQPREDYEQWLAAIRKKLERGGVIVIFGPPRVDDRQVLDELGAERLVTYYDSALFGYPWVVNPLPPPLPPREAGTQ